MQRFIIRMACLAAAVLTVVWVSQTAGADPLSGETEVFANVGTPQLSCAVSVEDAADRPSPLKTVEFSFDGGTGLLCYGAPSARGREVMGGLVPFGSPWRLGANEPTAIHLSAGTSIGGLAVDAGSYSFYAMPGADEWAFALNTNLDRWGIPINADVRSTEVGTFTVPAGEASGMVETLTFSHSDGMLVMEWENTRVEIPIG